MNQFKEWVKKIHFYHLYFIQLGLASLLILLIITSPYDSVLGYFTMRTQFAFLPVVIYSIMSLIHIFEYVSKIHQIKPYLRFFFLGFFTFFAISLIGASIHDINQVLFVTSIFYVLVLQVALIEHRWQENKPKLPSFRFELPDGWYSPKNYHRFLLITAGLSLFFIIMLLFNLSKIGSIILLYLPILGVIVFLSALYYRGELRQVQQRYQKNLDYTLLLKQVNSLRRFKLKKNAKANVDLVHIEAMMFQDIKLAEKMFEEVEVPTYITVRHFYYLVGLRLYFIGKQKEKFDALYVHSQSYYQHLSVFFRFSRLQQLYNLMYQQDVTQGAKQKGIYRYTKKNRYGQILASYFLALHAHALHDKNALNNAMQKMSKYVSYVPVLKQEFDALKKTI